jgi:hypothetical protein
LLLWFSNSERITKAAGLSDAQSVRCIAKHLSGAAQRMFFDRLSADGLNLSDLSVKTFANRLLLLIPGYKARFLTEVMDLPFHKHSLFESLRRFQLLWRYSSLDENAGELVHTYLKQELDAAHPSLLSDALTHCGLTLRMRDNDTLDSIVQKTYDILTALQAYNKLPMQFDGKADAGDSKGQKGGSNPATGKPPQDKDRKANPNKRPMPAVERNSPPAAKKPKMLPEGNGDLAAWAMRQGYCLKCGEYMHGVSFQTHSKSAECTGSTKTPDQVVALLRPRMTAAQDNKSGTKPHPKKQNK